MGRSIGLDVHRDFCQVAIADGGRARDAGADRMTIEEVVKQVVRERHDETNLADRKSVV